jgi:hypothetical protein
MNLTFGNLTDSYKHLLCSHDQFFMDCRICQMLTLLCINKYDRQLPWLPKDVCKLIFQALLKRPYRYDHKKWKCLAAEAA